MKLILIKKISLIIQKKNQDQAILFLSNIEDVFFQLCKQPNLGRITNEIKENTFSFPVQKHIIFYTVATNKLIIIKVLHSNRDIPKHFKIKTIIL